MKDYIIFLTSGESIFGTMSDTAARKLKMDYIECAQSRRVYKDTEGELLLDMSKVAALAVNKPVTLTKRGAGFKIEEEE